ncbi:hypothetical protein IWX47DRAFT_543503 [Phyllosticta citricarpa]|uniref:Secreted protein n=1 Tax=Phyllosticta citricarpa TaxID=55181 RepID=A0ABR1M711_9PEZI
MAIIGIAWYWRWCASLLSVTLTAPPHRRPLTMSTQRLFWPAARWPSSVTAALSAFRVGLAPVIAALWADFGILFPPTFPLCIEERRVSFVDCLERKFSLTGLLFAARVLQFVSDTNHYCFIPLLLLLSLASHLLVLRALLLCTMLSTRYTVRL